jgi:uncharacterized protein YcbX
MKYAVAALWRFPVKSMGGESLESVDVNQRGLVGDREWAVYDGDGKLASGKRTSRFRRMDQVFQLLAATMPDGSGVEVVLPSGQRVRAGEGAADIALSDHFGEDVELAPESDVAHQDAGQVSLIGTATLAELGRRQGLGTPVDARHLRANIVVTTEEPFVEETWVGRELAVGRTVLKLVEPVERCRMVEVAQVGVAGADGLLRLISDERNLCAAVYADVVTPGTIRVDDAVVPR